MMTLSGQIQQFISSLRSSLGNNFIKAIQFGSSLEQPGYNDIDILVLVREKQWSVREQIASLALDCDLRYGINISPLILTEEEYEQNTRHENLFSKEIAGGVLL